MEIQHQKAINEPLLSIQFLIQVFEQVVSHFSTQSLSNRKILGPREEEKER